MKLTSILIGLFFLFNTNFSNAFRMDERQYIRDNFPHMEEVLTFLNQQLEYECNDCAYGVAKKQTGYYLTMYNYSTKKTEEVPIWKPELNGFTAFDIDDYVDLTKVRSANSSDLNNLYNFRAKYDFMLVFGYEEWAADAIKIISSYAPFLSNEDREIMARANGDLALNIIENRISGKEFLPRKYAKIKQERVDLFMDKINLIMDFWTEIKKDDESYRPLIISELNLKIGNEYMHYYNLLISIKEEKLADDFLKRAYFSPSQVQSAKNLLYGCPEKSFLFTQGDSDTFPLWYVQKKLNYRKDVIVLNTSLLYTHWYVQMNKERRQYTSIIDQKNYGKLLNKGQYIDRGSQVEPFSQWLTNKLTLTDSLSYSLVPESFMIPFQGSNLEIKLKGPSVGQNAFVMLDLIASNPDREFNFASPFQLYSLGLVNNYLSRGKSFLMTNTPISQHSDQESIDLLDNLLFYMDYKYLASLNNTASSELNLLTYGIAELANTFDTDRERMLQKFIKQVPTSSLIEIGNFGHLEIVNSLYADQLPYQSQLLKKELKTAALDRIKKITSLNKTFDQDISDMEELFSIYAGVRIQWLQYEEVFIKNADKDVLIAIKEKVDSLQENPVMLQREWTHLKLVAMKVALDGLDLSQE